MSPYAGFATPEGTWWMQLIHRLGGQLLVNNSFAGSPIRRRGNYAACLPGRIRSLATEAAAPDLVLVCTGLNDVAHRVDLGAFRRDCRDMVQKLAAQYPAPKSGWGPSPWVSPPRAPGTWTPPPLEDRADYNDVLRQCVAEAGPSVHLADLTPIDGGYETVNGTHPNRAGMVTFADGWYQAMAGTVPTKRLKTARGESPQGFPRSSETRWTNGQPARDLVPAGCFGKRMRPRASALCQRVN